MKNKTIVEKAGDSIMSKKKEFKLYFSEGMYEHMRHRYERGLFPYLNGKIGTTIIRNDGTCIDDVGKWGDFEFIGDFDQDEIVYKIT